MTGVSDSQGRQPFIHRMLKRTRTGLGGVVLIGCALVEAYAMPVLNPDVRQTTIDQTICVPGFTRQVRPSTSYTNGVKRKLLRDAGIEPSRISDFELDHIVPLALGGHPRRLENLMLQPWEGADGAKRKDRLEVKLQCLVCARQVPLAEAQQSIYTDWPAAYHRYAKVKCQRKRTMGRSADS